MKKLTIRILATLMVCFMLLGIAACGEDAPAPAPTPAPTPQAQETESPPTPEPTPEPDEPSEETAVMPTRGEWDGNVYTNEYLGLRIVIPGDWSIASEADIAALMGLGEDFLSDITDSELPEDFWDMADVASFHDMMASSLYTGASIQVIFERLTFPLTRISGSDYIDVAAPMLEDMGFDVDTSHEGTTRIGDNEWYLLSTELDYGVGSLFQHMYISTYEGFVRMITITYTDESEPISELLGMIIGLNDPIPEIVSSMTLEVDEDLVGTWAWDIDDSFTYIFSDDGTLVRGFDGLEDEYNWGTEDGEHLMIGSGPFAESWTYTISNNVLTLESRQEAGVVYSYDWVG